MIEPQSQLILQDIVRRESLSLLSYIGDAFPWTTSKGGPALARLREVVASQKDAVNDLGTYLTRVRARMPYIGSYPASFTSWNYIALDYMLPHLLKTEQQLTSALEADVSRLTGGEPKEQAEKLLAVKRRNLETLRNLTAAAAA